MNLTGTTLEEGAYVVAQLGASHDGVVAEYDAFAVQYGPVGDEFHLGHEVASTLVAGSEAAWPGRGIFQHGTLIWYAAAF